MAVRPTDVLENVSLETVESVQGLFIPLTSLPGLTAEEANPTTGDGREVVRVFLSTVSTNLSALPSEPVGMSVSTSEPVRNGQKQQEFVYLFNVNVPANSYVLPAQT